MVITVVYKGQLRVVLRMVKKELMFQPMRVSETTTVCGIKG